MLHQNHVQNAIKGMYVRVTGKTTDETRFRKNLRLKVRKKVTGVIPPTKNKSGRVRNYEEKRIY